MFNIAPQKGPKYKKGNKLLQLDFWINKFIKSKSAKNLKALKN